MTGNQINDPPRIERRFSPHVCWDSHGVIAKRKRGSKSASPFSDGPFGL